MRQWAVLGVAVLLLAAGVAAKADEVSELKAELDAAKAQLKASKKAGSACDGCLRAASDLTLQLKAAQDAGAECDTSLKAAEKEAESAEKVAEKASDKADKAEKVAEGCKADLEAAKATLSKVKDQHAGVKAEAAKLQSAVDKLKTDLVKLEAEAAATRKEASAGASCKLSLNKVDSELAALRDALKEADEALVPPRLARLARSASGQLSEAWAEVQASPHYNAAAAKAAELAAEVSKRAAELKVAVGPHLAVALEKAESARARLREVQGELATVIDLQLRASPALAPYADPVVVQALVWAAFGAPLLLLLPLLAVMCGRRKPAPAAAVPRKKGAAAGPAGKGGAGKRVVRDGRDVLYTP